MSFSVTCSSFFSGAREGGQCAYFHGGQISGGARRRVAADGCPYWDLSRAETNCPPPRPDLDAYDETIDCDIASDCENIADAIDDTEAVDETSDTPEPDGDDAEPDAGDSETGDANGGDIASSDSDEEE